MFKKQKYTTISTAEPEVAMILSTSNGLVLSRDYSKEKETITIYNTTDDFKKHINEMVVNNTSDYVPVCFNEIPIRYMVRDSYTKIRVNIIKLLNNEIGGSVLQDVKRMSSDISTWRGQNMYFVALDTHEPLSASTSRIMDAVQYYGKTALVIVLQCNCDPVEYANCVNITYYKKDHASVVAIITALLANPKPAREYRSNELLLTNRLLLL